MARILVVDDDKHIVAILRELLSIDGHEVITAYNAFDALELVKQNALNLVITDVLMPDMDGIELICQIRNFDKNLRIVAMSGGRRAFVPANLMLDSATANFKVTSAAVRGANATLVKPFVRAQLQATVTKVLSR